MLATVEAFCPIATYTQITSSPLLVQDSVDRHRGLTRLTVTDDQFTLTTPNGDHGVDRRNAQSALVHTPTFAQ